MIQLAPAALSDIIQDALRHKLCFAARRGHGTFLTFDFGKPVPQADTTATRYTGEFQLWIQHATWSIAVADERASWRSAKAKIDSLLHRFEGAHLVRCDADPPVFTFHAEASSPTEEGLALQPSYLLLSVSIAPAAYADPEDDLFTLFMASGRSLSCDQQGQARLE